MVGRRFYLRIISWDGWKAFLLEDYQLGWLENVFIGGLSVGMVGRRFYLRNIMWAGWKAFLLKDYLLGWLEGVFT